MRALTDDGCEVDLYSEVLGQLEGPEKSRLQFMNYLTCLGAMPRIIHDGRVYNFSHLPRVGDAAAPVIARLKAVFDNYAAPNFELQIANGRIHQTIADFVANNLELLDALTRDHR